MPQEPKWETHYRIAFPAHQLEARPALDGEPVGIPELEKIALAGDWVCRNPKNGYTWAMCEENFHALYCKVGARPAVKASTAKGSATDRSKLHASPVQNNGRSGPLFGKGKEAEHEKADYED